MMNAMKKTKTIGILGGGVMGSLMARGIMETFPAASLIICERNEENAKNLQKKYHACVTTNGDDLARADIVILAVKPQDFSSVDVKIKKDALVISIMAGVSVAAIRKKTGAKKIVRAMPNTPAKYGKGFTAYFASRTVNRNEVGFCEQLFNSFGISMRVSLERDIDKVTAITGSGPAYLLTVLAHFISAAENLGFSKKIAYQMVMQTLAGTKALLTDGSDPKRLITQIASKGGTTEAALREFEKAGLRKIWQSAVDAAYHRARELGIHKIGIHKKGEGP